MSAWRQLGKLTRKHDVGFHKREMPGFGQFFVGMVVGVPAGALAAAQATESLAISDNVKAGINVAGATVGAAVAGFSGFRLALRHRGARTLRTQLRGLVQSGAIDRILSPSVLETLGKHSDGKFAYADLVEHYGSEAALPALREYAGNLSASKIAVIQRYGLGKNRDIAALANHSLTPFVLHEGTIELNGDSPYHRVLAGALANTKNMPARLIRPNNQVETFAPNQLSVSVKADVYNGLGTRLSQNPALLRQTSTNEGDVSFAYAPNVAADPVLRSWADSLQAEVSAQLAATK